MLVNTSTRRLVVVCRAPTESGYWQGIQPDRLRSLQEEYQADTCFLTKPNGKLVLLKTLAVRDSLQLGAGREAFWWPLTTPPLAWESVTVQPAAGQPIHLTASTIKPFVTRTYLDIESCCGEYEKITRIYQLALP